MLGVLQTGLGGGLTEPLWGGSSFLTCQGPHCVLGSQHAVAAVRDQHHHDARYIWRLLLLKCPFRGAQ